MSVLGKSLIIKSPDGAEWSVQVSQIVIHRSQTYGGTDESLTETVELFESDEYEIKDWAKNNMNWADVEKFARKIKEPSYDMQDIWVDGEMRIE